MKVLLSSKIAKKREKLLGNDIELLKNIPSEKQLVKGLKGKIFGVVDTGSILVKWENDCRLNILPDVDKGHYKITKAKNDKINRKKNKNLINLNGVKK